MKTFMCLLFLTGIVVAAGCNRGTPGGPGVASSDDNSGTVTTTNRPTYGEADKTFSLDVPALSADIKQGETTTVTIGINRGNNFDEDVTLELTGLPQGVTMEPASAKIPRSEKEVQISFLAAEDAALGNFTIDVVGHPTQGADATSQLKLTITKIDQAIDP